MSLTLTTAADDSPLTPGTDKTGVCGPGQHTIKGNTGLEMNWYTAIHLALVD